MTSFYQNWLSRQSIQDQFVQQILAKNNPHTNFDVSMTYGVEQGWVNFLVQGPHFQNHIIQRAA